MENYDPNTGGPIVYYYWSNHYNHSSYNDLIISGLCGIRPSGTDTLVVNPLVDNSISYFWLDDVPYHGHRITVVYDKNGNRYNIGKGITVLVDGEKKSSVQKKGKYSILLRNNFVKQSSDQSENFALNITRKGYPLPYASVNNTPDSIYQATDGRIWYFKEISNYWSTLGSVNPKDWFAIDFGKTRAISSIKIYPYADGYTFATPENILIEYYNDQHWLPVKLTGTFTGKLTGNTQNSISFNKVEATKIRISFSHPGKQVGIGELECY